MLIHTVYFYLKPELGEKEREAFLKEGLESLRGIAAIEKIFIGKAAPVAKRPAVDDEYDYAVVSHFKDVAAHDAYQVDPLHKAFLARFSQDWTRTRISDIEC